MGLLLSVLYRLFGSANHKVLIVGLDNAGKSTILYQFVLKEAVYTTPTVGSNVEEVVWKNLHLVMWDIGGQSSLRPSWSTYFAGSDFVIVVIDSTDRDRLWLAKKELYKLLAAEVFLQIVNSRFEGAKKVKNANIRQQTGCFWMYVSCGNQPKPQSYINSRPSLAHSGMLCPDRRGSSSRVGLVCNTGRSMTFSRIRMPNLRVHNSSFPPSMVQSPFGHCC
ncbi:unnamed protein product [Calicophoron daubneyi]|uniref:ADP-ribosylation factor-like protein 5B n=1 Tax=Calicophoron daubneyi TaxID=300641 RepID=A0AAV2TYN0_CALDB